MSAVPTEGHEPPGYLDSASGLPLSPVVEHGLSAALRGGWPDPGRRYPGARSAAQLLDQARASFAATLGVPPAGVFFAGSPEEALRWVLTGFVGPQRRRIVVSAVEDLAVLRECDRLSRGGVDLLEVPVDATATVAADRVVALASQAPSVVVVQDGNLEVGTRQPVAEIAARLPAGTPLVMDATAVLGREPPATGWDALVADPRMWGGPPGSTLVAVRDPGRFRPDVAVTDGFGGVESARPPVAVVAAAALALERAVAQPQDVAPLVDRLRGTVVERIPDVQVLGHPSARVGYLAMFSFLYVAADELVDELARRGWSVASGASCTSDTMRPHHVLVAMGALTHGSLRVSVAPWTTASDIDAFADDLVDVVARIRAESGATGL